MSSGRYNRYDCSLSLGIDNRKKVQIKKNVYITVQLHNRKIC